MTEVVVVEVVCMPIGKHGTLSQIEPIRLGARVPNGVSRRAQARVSTSPYARANVPRWRAGVCTVPC
ncbi:MAG: hypothetical protein L0287_12735 [Anaerolineae bacterium]|nr:hypothetical protein [Anaerolineae bacterium]